MKWNILSRSECEQALKAFQQSGYNKNLSEDYTSLRNSLLTIHTEILASGMHADGYAYDLAFALQLYALLNQRYEMNERAASNDGIWRYLSIKVVPDIVASRWGYKDARFWKESRRIWLKTLWWYVYLSWQGNTENTRCAVAGNTTDILVQLVERPGPQGYRVGLCREIIRQLGNSGDPKNRAGLFRKIMVLNTARLKVLEPELYDQGEVGYVRQLFEYFGA